MKRERGREGETERERGGGEESVYEIQEGKESVYEIQVCGIVIIMTLEFFSCKSDRKFYLILAHTTITTTNVYHQKSCHRPSRLRIRLRPGVAKWQYRRTTANH